MGSKLGEDLRQARRGDLDAAARFYDETVEDAWRLGRCFVNDPLLAEMVVEQAYRTLFGDETRSSSRSARSHLLEHVRSSALMHRERDLGEGF